MRVLGSKSKCSKCLLAIAMFLTVVGVSVIAPRLSQTVYAAGNTCTWLNPANGGNFNNPSNWSGCGPTGVPVNGDDISFVNTSVQQKNVNNDIPGLTLHSMSFDNAGIDMGGNDMSLSGALNLGSEGFISFLQKITLSSDVTMNASGSSNVAFAHLDVGANTLTLTKDDCTSNYGLIDIFHLDGTSAGAVQTNKHCPYASGFIAIGSAIGNSPDTYGGNFNGTLNITDTILYMYLGKYPVISSSAKINISGDANTNSHFRPALRLVQSKYSLVDMTIPNQITLNIADLSYEAETSGANLRLPNAKLTSDETARYSGDAGYPPNSNITLTVNLASNQYCLSADSGSVGTLTVNNNGPCNVPSGSGSGGGGGGSSGAGAGSGAGSTGSGSASGSSGAPAPSSSGPSSSSSSGAPSTSAPQQSTATTSSASTSVAEVQTPQQQQPQASSAPQPKSQPKPTPSPSANTSQATAASTVVKPSPTPSAFMDGKLYPILSKADPIAFVSLKQRPANRLAVVAGASIGLIAIGGVVVSRRKLRAVVQTIVARRAAKA